MRLHVRPIEYSKTALAEWLSGTLEAPRLEEASSLKVYRLSSAPSGKHSLTECSEYERTWRSIAADVLGTLKGEHKKCVIWAQGPFDTSGLLPILSYVEQWNAIGLRYHIEGFTYPGGRGYYSSWISFEFERNNLKQIMGDSKIDFANARLAALVCGPALVESIIGIAFDSLGTLGVLQQQGILLASPQHFEGFDVVGLQDVLKAPIATLAAANGLG